MLKKWLFSHQTQIIHNKILRLQDLSSQTLINRQTKSDGLLVQFEHSPFNFFFMTDCIDCISKTCNPSFMHGVGTFSFFLTWSKQVCATEQGMVLRVLSNEDSHPNFGIFPALKGAFTMQASSYPHSTGKGISAV